MKKIASLALALSLAATASFAQTPEGAIAVTTPGAVAGQTVVIAGTTYTWVLVGGMLFLVLLASASASDSNT